MSRLIIVSNRLPVTLSDAAGTPHFEPSAGGLATGLDHYHAQSESLWIGYPGDLGAVPAEQRLALQQWLGSHRYVPVGLSADEVARYYEGYSNSVLWPLLHYMSAGLPLHVGDWDAYQAVNRRFADAIADVLEDGDVVWIHDYQLMLVPALLRERAPDAAIGFFLHVPFPSSEVFGILPQRAELIEGMLGADLIGFHTASYRRHFANSALRHLGTPTDLDCLRWNDRAVELGVFPMGVDAQAFANLAATDEVRQRALSYRQEDGVRLVVGIDRLDYTKGLPTRLSAFHQLLEAHPELRRQVRLVQVGVPSRVHVTEYRAFRREVDELIGRVNGALGTPEWTPIHWIARPLPRDEVVSLYCAADVMLVTPIRDGMNLVAKEFAAARTDEDGVLVLSEFAGAAAELAEAIQVNPFDIDGMADALYRALTAPREERRARMIGLRRRVFANNVDQWAHDFIERLEEAAAGRGRHARHVPPLLPPDVLTQVRMARDVRVFLDYEGSVVPFASTPALARPGRDVLQLLATLGATRGVEVHVLSGRDPETLDEWLGALPVSLHAEHGAWSRLRRQTGWTLVPAGELKWRAPVRRVLHAFARNTPGSLVEEKALSLAWHFRHVDAEFGGAQARELQMQLAGLLANTSAEVLLGDHVVEVRPAGVNKSLPARRVVAEAPDDALVIAIGDDSTDEELFAALPSEALTIHVGWGASRAQYRLRSVIDVRAFLAQLAEALAAATPEVATVAPAQLAV